MQKHPRFPFVLCVGGKYKIEYWLDIDGKFPNRHMLTQISAGVYGKREGHAVTDLDMLR